MIQVRRRALPSEQMALIKEYANSGKPVLGLRTASHAFNANQVVPNPDAALAAGTGKVSEFLDQWPEFDKDVLPALLFPCIHFIKTDLYVLQTYRYFLRVPSLKSLLNLCYG